MKVAIITRSTLFTGFGGDTVQITSLASCLNKAGIIADIRLCNEEINYNEYDLLHVFNSIRPADTLRHVRLSGKPYVLSPVFLDHSLYEKSARKGLAGFMSGILSYSAMEYIKAVARMIVNGEKIQSPEYFRLGHLRSVRKLASGAAMLLPNSESEYRRFSLFTGLELPYRVVYNGVDPEIFADNTNVENSKEDDLVLCVARIEGNKNQINLIRALNNTRFRVVITGRPSVNHQDYYRLCKKEAASNISFAGFVKQEELLELYNRARVHVLPSYNETTGLSSLEAASRKCSLVITRGGDTEEYFGNEAEYCDPSDPDSIFLAVERASRKEHSQVLIEKIRTTYNWEAAARTTLNVYREVIGEISALNPSITQEAIS